MPPRVSVVIPSYNNAAFIESTLESVLAQSFTDLEVCVSDHSSQDGTWDLVQRFAQHDKRVRLSRTSAGGGAERNWNNATSMATGELVKLVCGDDLLHRDCVRRQVLALDAAGPGAVLVAAKRDVIDSEGRTLVRGRGLGKLAGRVEGGVVARAVVRSGTNLLGEPACVLFRREALQCAGGWDGRHGYVVDLRTYLRVLRQGGELIAIRESLAAFRISLSQWSVRLEKQQTESVVALLDELAVEWPRDVSARDLAVGKRVVVAQAARRRLAYRFLRLKERYSRD